jgi:hypothetical protein
MRNSVAGVVDLFLYQFSKYRLQIEPTEYEFVQQLKQSHLWSLPPISEQSRALIHLRRQVISISTLFLDIAKSVQFLPYEISHYLTELLKYYRQNVQFFEFCFTFSDFY